MVVNVLWPICQSVSKDQPKIIQEATEDLKKNSSKEMWAERGEMWKPLLTKNINSHLSSAKKSTWLIPKTFGRMFYKSKMEHFG